MASAYEVMTEQQNTSRDFTTTCSNNNRVNSVTATDMEKTSSLSSLSSSSVSRASVTSDLSFEELPPVPSTEVNHVPPGELFDEDLNVLEDKETMDTNEECKNETNIDTCADSINSTWQINKSENKQQSFLVCEKQKEEKIISTSAGNVTLENASVCSAKKEEDQRNQSTLEIREREQRDNIARNLQDCTAEDVQTCCENVVKLDLRTTEKQNKTERDIISRQDSDSFYDAVRSGNVKRVSALIASGSVQNLDEPDWNVSGDPPLLIAAANHCLPMLSLLLASGCNPAVRSPRGETALHKVILNGGPGDVLKFVEDLLKNGCPPGVKEAGSGSTALHVLSRQLAHTPLKSFYHNFDAALKILKLLAETGPVNAKDHQGRSALHILASSNIFDNNRKADIESLIEILLAAGADTALKNDRGETPLHESLECGALNTATLLIPHTPTGITSRYGETPLHITSRKNHIDIVTKLLEHGEDPGAQDARGNTPLHLASARGFHQTVSLLVTSPLAQLEKINIDGLTALQVAAESGFVNTVKILLKAGADPSQTMHYCETILRRHPDISLLIDHELTRRRQLAA